MKAIGWNCVCLDIFFKMLTKCFTLLKVVHETFFLRELDRHPDREAYPPDLVSPSTPSSLFQPFLFCHSPLLLLTLSFTKGDRGIAFLLSPSHRFCTHPTLHRTFSSHRGKNLLHRRKAVWVWQLVFLPVDTINFLPISWPVRSDLHLCQHKKQRQEQAAWSEEEASGTSPVMAPSC